MPNNITQPTVYLQSGNPETEARAPDGYSAGQLGSKLTVKVGGVAKTYQLVSVGTLPVAMVDNAVVWWSDRAAYEVTTDAAALGRGHVAGIARATAVAGQVTCIQIKGRGDVKFLAVPTAAPTAAGLICTPSATDGEADCLAAGTAALYPQIGLSAGAPAANIAAVDINIEDNTP